MTLQTAMNLPLQMFGTVQTNEGIVNAMFSRDADQMDKAMIQWAPPSGKGVGLLMNMVEIDSTQIHLECAVVYTSDKNGALNVARDAELRNYYMGVKATLRKEDSTLVGTWRDSGTGSGNVAFQLLVPLRRAPNIQLSSWAEFKSWASEQRAKGQFIDFRGHGSSAFSLCTTLQRAGRTRMERFCYETLPEFKNKAEAILDMRFNPGDPEDFAILAGLAQHHGLPTPLLDLTASPYVAAFFAFADALENRSNRSQEEHPCVRVFAFSHLVQMVASPVVTLTAPQQYATHLSVSFRKNARLVAQQGRFLVTNISDLESFMCADAFRDFSLLTAVDIPASCTAEALEDLKFMGLSAATMFPGLDGVCRSMRHEMEFRKK